MRPTRGAAGTEALRIVQAADRESGGLRRGAAGLRIPGSIHAPRRGWQPSAAPLRLLKSYQQNEFWEEHVCGYKTDGQTCGEPAPIYCGGLWLCQKHEVQALEEL